MTIEIKVPIKCSTVKRISTQMSTITHKLFNYVSYSILPLGLIITISGILASFNENIPDPDPLGVHFILIGGLTIIAGFIVWLVNPPITIKCIPDYRME